MTQRHALAFVASIALSLALASSAASAADKQTADAVAQWGKNLDLRSRAIAGEVATADDRVLDLEKLILDNAEQVKKTVGERRAKRGKGVVKVVIREPEKEEPEKVEKVDPAKLNPGQWARAQQAKQAFGWQRETAVANVKLAREALVKARAAQDSSVKRVHFKAAQRFLSVAESAKESMDQTLSVWRAPASDDPPVKRIRLSREKLWQGSKTYRFGRRLAGFEDGNGEARLEMWDGAARFPEVVARGAATAVPTGWKTSTPTLRGRFKGPRVSPDDADRPGILSFGSAQQIELQPLADAVARVDPAVARAPLFRKCGTDDAICPSPGLLELLAKPKTREALRNVGGVALDVTFDMLAGSGLADFSGGADIQLIRDPVLVSLATLAERAAPHAAPERWKDLPDALRHPGGIERVMGFVLAPDGSDVFLVGLTATSPENRIDIDSLVLALRTAWRDGAIMGVSLDPQGPEQFDRHYPRVIAVPTDSLPAKIMLDADYSMKSVSLGLTQLAGTGVDIDGIVRRHVTPGRRPPSSARLWFTPARIGRGDIVRSASGRTVLVAAGYRLLTEDLAFSRGGAMLGTNKSSPMYQEIAAAADRVIQDGMLSSSGDPTARVYVLLRGLTDLIVAANLLRVTGVDHPALSRLAALPHRALAGADAIRTVYRGLESTVDFSGRPFLLRGGAEMDVGIDAGPAVPVRDSRLERLEAVAAAAARRGALVTATRLTIGVSDTRAGSATAAADTPAVPDTATLRRRGRSAFSAKDFEAARAHFLAATRLDRADAEAWAGASAAALSLGDHDDAMRLIRASMILAPWEAAYGWLAMDIAWRRDQEHALSLLDSGGRRLLSEYYTALAEQSRHADNRIAAQRYAEWAVRLWPDNPGPYSIFGHNLPRSMGRDRLYFFSRAVRNLRDMEKRDGQRYSTELAIALAAVAEQRLELVVERVRRVAFNGIPKEWSAGMFLFFQYRELRQSRLDARDAVERDPDFTQAHLIRILGDAYWAVTLKGARKRAQLGLVLSEIDELIQGKPGEFQPYNVRANIQLLMDDTAGAIHSLRRAIELGPRSVRPMLMLNRARARIALRRCAAGKRDLQSAKSSLGREYRPQIEFVETLLARCLPG